jgi:hypothetical protein
MTTGFTAEPYQRGELLCTRGFLGMDGREGALLLPDVDAELDGQAEHIEGRRH